MTTTLDVASNPLFFACYFAGYLLGVYYISKYLTKFVCSLEQTENIMIYYQGNARLFISLAICWIIKTISMIAAVFWFLYPVKYLIKRK